MRPPHSPAAPSDFGHPLCGASRIYSRVRTTTPAAWHSTRYTESGIPRQTRSGSQRPSHIGMRIRWPRNILRPRLSVLGEVVVLQPRFVLPMAARRYSASAFHPSRPDRAAQPASHVSDNPHPIAGARVLHNSPIGVTTVSLAHCSVPYPRLALAGKVSPVGGSTDFLRG